ncbi:MAG: rod shape-determining protein MreC [Phycisphaerales bacterium]|nr:MAG: rod shape-determining protein MreC [Phycisphaerales bacterium]
MSRRSAVFVLLLGISVCGLLVPSQHSGWLMNLVQVGVPFQDVANRIGDSVEGALAGPPAPAVSVEEHQGVVRQKEAFEHLAHALAQRVEVLERRNRELTAIRRLGLDGRGQLIRARVISEDLISWRESRLVDAGSLGGVRRGAAVVSNHFTVDVGRDKGVQDGLRVLSSETLVGAVWHTGTHTSRVQLLTDPSTEMVVTIGRHRDGELVPLGKDFWMVGVGNGWLEVRDVGHKYVKEGDVRVGDVVLTVGDEAVLPVPVVIGAIRKIRQDPDNGLLYILDVEPAVAPSGLRHVYIVNTHVEASE